jgi:large subunit ribosomal protein L29
MGKLRESFMKFSEIKDMTQTELAAKSRDLRTEMFNLRLQQASAQLEKPARLRTLRRDIARVETRASQLRNTKKAA